MENRKYLDGLFKRINYLAAMASKEEPDYDALSIEHAEILKKIKEVSATIKEFTPTKADLDSAKNKDRIRLSAKKDEINELRNELEENNELLTQENENLIDVMNKISSVNKQIQTLSEQEENISKHKQLSREFKQFVTTYKKDIEELRTELNEAEASKARIQSSIDIYSEEKLGLENKIGSLDNEIRVLEGNLKTRKAYDNTGLIREKNLIRANYEKELASLNDRKNAIENEPIYLASQMKKLLEAGKGKSQVTSMLSKIYEQAQAQPYMAIIIRGGNTQKLIEEYEVKKLEKEEIVKRINKTNYSLKVLPVEDSRQNSIEKMINLYRGQIGDYKNLIKENNIAISSLAGTAKSLTDDYEEKSKSVEQYASDLSIISDTTELAHKKHEHEKMLKVLANEREVIAAVKTDIAELILQNEKIEKVINDLESKIATLTKESNEILNRQMSRNNYYDIIKRNRDEAQLNAVKKDIHYILKRSKYRHYNIANLYADISQGVKTIYTSKEKTVKKAEKPKKTTKYILEPIVSKKEHKEEIKQSKTETHVTTLGELLETSKEEVKNSPVVTKEEVHESVTQLEKTMDQLFPKTENKNFELPIDVAAIVKDQKSKQEQASIELGLDELKGLADSIQANISTALEETKNEDVKEEMKVEKPKTVDNTKIKVVDIKPLKPVVELPKQKNDKIKVVAIESMAKQKIETPTKSIDLDVYNPFVNNQDVFAQEDNVVSYSRAV